MSNTKILWVGVAIVAVITLLFIVNSYNFTQFGARGTTDVVTPPANTDETTTPDVTEDIETATSTESKSRGAVEIIGESANGNDITAYTFGTGEKEILVIGGIHGGYSWNTAQLAFEMIDYYTSRRDELTDIRITIIPLLNPDGFNTVFGSIGKLTSTQMARIPTNTVPGRFNGNTVDLNRNFDCQWQATGVWQKQAVSGGSGVFSEPETQALRSYVQKYRPDAVIAYYSAAGGVYASNCNNGVSEGTKTLMRQYGTASKYQTHESYDYYATTGDMTNWFAKENIPAISVLLTNHTDVEYSRNQSGLTAVISALVNEN